MYLENLNFKYEWAYLAIGNLEIDRYLFSKLTLRIERGVKLIVN